MKVVGRPGNFFVIETVLGVSAPFQQHPNRLNEETLVEIPVESRALLCSSVMSELVRDWFEGGCGFKRGFMLVGLVQGHKNNYMIFDNFIQLSEGILYLKIFFGLLRIGFIFCLGLIMFSIISPLVKNMIWNTLRESELVL